MANGAPILGGRVGIGVAFEPQTRSISIAIIGEGEPVPRAHVELNREQALHFMNGIKKAIDLLDQNKAHLILPQHSDFRV